LAVQLSVSNGSAMAIIDAMARDETINSDMYIITLQKLKNRYRRLRLNRNPGDMFILHDNACLHTSTNPVCNRQNRVGLCFPNPPYSPDLAPSDFHLFEPLKDALHGTRFEDDESMIRAVKTWLREQETS
jgi:histone-lysine N-methyltransferase SETMAR